MYECVWYGRKWFLLVTHRSTENELEEGEDVLKMIEKSNQEPKDCLQLSKNHNVKILPSLANSVWRSQKPDKTELKTPPN